MTPATRSCGREDAHPRSRWAWRAPTHGGVRSPASAYRGVGGGQDDGFSMMEMAVVLGMIVVLLAVSVPVLARQNQVQKLDAAARELAGDLREAQQLARTRRVSCQVVFDSAAGTYTVFADGNRVRGPVGVSVTLTPAFAGTDPAVVTFDPLGRANEGLVTLSSPGGSRQVHVGRAATVYITR